MTRTDPQPAAGYDPPRSNRYVLLDHFNQAIDLSAGGDYGWGRDYHLNVLRHVEDRGLFAGVTFFIAYHPPETLPDYGPHVVLVLIGDEFHLPRAYFSRIAAILRCYGPRPAYLDGWPVTPLRLAAAAQYLHKRLVQAKALVREIRMAGLGGLAGSGRKTLQVPLGYFRDFDVPVRPVGQRRLGHSFMGSVSQDFAAKPLLQKILDGPKQVSRRRMLDALARRGQSSAGAQALTPDFASSTQNHDAYVEVLCDTKIALAPRGVSHETYRFFEAFKAGCVVICEPQPPTWYNRDHPGIVVRDWSRLPGLLDALLGDAQRLEALWAESRAYWRDRIGEAAVADAVVAFLQGRLDKDYRRPVARD